MSDDLEEQRRAGRPTKFNDETVDRLCTALADGMPIKGACAIAGIGVTTLSEWREQHPELEARIAKSRELFREKALQEIKKAVVAGDWRAAAKALELVFPADYRGGNKIEVSATANVTGIVLTEERLRHLQERRKGAEERALSQLSTRENP